MAVLFVVAASRTAGASIIKTVGELIPKKHQEPGTKGRRRWGNGGGRGGAGCLLLLRRRRSITESVSQLVRGTGAIQGVYKTVPPKTERDCIR